jgi:hypothetical protein
MQSNAGLRARPSDLRKRLLPNESANRVDFTGEMQILLLRYTRTLLTQMARTTVCNRHHSVDQQLCRWLLLSLDRLHTNQLIMIQELIAPLLGVRRAGVSGRIPYGEDGSGLDYKRYVKRRHSRRRRRCNEQR